jgi:glycerophosphoryl diester phosphodiesterase
MTPAVRVAAGPIPGGDIPCYGDDPGPLPLAHRGGAGLAPENTMAAFAQAYALGFRYLETDIRVTADGVCALFHDAGTRRLTGLPGRFGTLSWAQVGRLRILGSEPVPRLEELLGAFPDARVSIDLKDPRALGRLAAAVRSLGAQDRVCLAGTADHWLAHARALLGGRLVTAMGWQSTSRLVAAARLGRRPRGVRPAPFVHVPLRLHGLPVFVDRLVPMAAELGCRVVVWTVNEPATMGRLLDAGVHGLITDRPDLLREVLVTRNAWRPPALRTEQAEPIPAPRTEQAEPVQPA